MIRNATISDSDAIAKQLWNTWHQFQIRQIGNPKHSYPSVDALAEEIRSDLNHWVVFECADPQKNGFFGLAERGGEKIYKKWGFPAHTVGIQHFASLLSGEALLPQFQALASHLAQQSLLLCIPSSLRDAYWAALKAGFKVLGECPLIVGTYLWLYLDREGKHEQIQSKLRKAKIIAA
jgi:hypothetical protein